MNDHPISSLMQTAMENIKDMVDVTTIVGDPVQTPDGEVILPISRVGFGFAAGGSQYTLSQKGHSGAIAKPEAQEMPFGGGAGGGVSISPIGFLVVGSRGVKMVSTEQANPLWDKIVDLVSQAPPFADKSGKAKRTDTDRP